MSGSDLYERGMQRVRHAMAATKTVACDQTLPGSGHMPSGLPRQDTCPINTAPN